MKNENYQQYDSIFVTDVATIGLQFDGESLTKVKYLDKKLTRKTGDKLAESVKNKIEKYLLADTNVQTLNIDIKLEVTDFQQRVLKELQSIPFGETRTYGEIARILKTSPRAVGNACRSNPLPIIIPCHRVVAANGIGGYDGAKSLSRPTVSAVMMALNLVIYLI